MGHRTEKGYTISGLCIRYMYDTISPKSSTFFSKNSRILIDIKMYSMNVNKNYEIEIMKQK